jgi:hypothetical protein
MYTLTLRDVLLIMSASLFFIGVLTFIIGVLVLVTRSSNKDISTLAAETKRLARKGIAEDVAGLVGNASALMGEIRSLVRTAAGIGIFLTVVGITLIAAAYWLITQVTWTA